MIDTINKDESTEKIKVLALCDYCTATGFGTVSKNIMQQLDSTGKYDLHIVGINYDGMPYDTEMWPGTVYPAISLSNMNMGDVYGRQRFLDLLGTGEYDVVYIIQDTFIIQTIIDQIEETKDALTKKFKTILYYPIDCTPKAEWIEKTVAQIDYPVPYTNYAKAETLAICPDLKLETPIYHGNNPDDFFYVPDRKAVKEFRTKYFNGKADGKFLLVNVNRNQPRKDVIRNFMILKELRDRGHEDVVLYLHMAHEDAGGNILVMADHFGFELQRDYFLPSPKVFNVNKGLGVDAINLLYNASDAVLSTTLGEGWGLSITEAMATKTPVIAPNNTSLTEMMADNRGVLVDAGQDPSLWIMKEGDNERLRPLMDVEDAADKIEAVMAGTLPDIEGAFKWVSDLSWSNICEQWEVIFEKAAIAARAETRKAVIELERQQKLNLNRAQRRAMKGK